MSNWRAKRAGQKRAQSSGAALYRNRDKTGWREGIDGTAAFLRAALR
jgi:hypothetical protein